MNPKQLRVNLMYDIHDAVQEHLSNYDIVEDVKEYKIDYELQDVIEEVLENYF